MTRYTNSQHQSAYLCDKHDCALNECNLISAHVEAYTKPANTDFSIRLIRAVEIANGITPVKKIRVSARMHRSLGLYYHRSEIALQAFGPNRLSLPNTALHELGHHWHFSEGKDWKLDRMRDWARIVPVNDLANNYEKRNITNIIERIAECFALFMIDPNCLSDAKINYFESQGLRSHSVWRAELKKLEAVPVEYLVKG